MWTRICVGIFMTYCVVVCFVNDTSFAASIVYTLQTVGNCKELQLGGWQNSRDVNCLSVTFALYSNLLVCYCCQLMKRLFVSCRSC